MQKRGGGAPPAGGCGSDMSVAAAYAAGESYSAPATPRRQWQRERPDEVRLADTLHDCIPGACASRHVCGLHRSKRLHQLTGGAARLLARTCKTRRAARGAAAALGGADNLAT